MEEKIFDVLIVGSGPSGLTAGIYCGRANLRTVVLGGSKWGGQLMLTTDVENFPGFAKGVLGPELMADMRRQSEKFGGLVLEQDVVEMELQQQPFVVKTASETYKARAVILATGAAAKWLGLESEKRLIGRGVSSCAPCDAPFFKNKRVVVAGGGDAAMEEALVLTRFASEVIVVHRRDSLRASKIMQERVLGHEKIKMVWNTEILEVLGESKVEGLRLQTRMGDKNLNAGVVLEGEKVISESESEKIWELPVEGVFVAIGHMPATGIIKGKIELDEKGYARVKNFAMDVDNHFPTMSSVDGVFVSGDVFDFHYRQAITAAGYGCMAAMDAIKWLEEKGIGKGLEQGW